MAEAITNWFGDVVSHPAVVVDAHSVDDIVNVMTHPGQYPSPVRAVGSNHSTTACGTVDGGTLIRMKMNRILDISADALTVEAGATYFDLAKELEQHGLEFFVNTEIGGLSAGSAACAGTKDASYPGEFGHVGSYVTAMKLVLPSGERLEISDAQPELMQKARSSYGLFGIVYEVTFRIRARIPTAVHHETFTLDDLVTRLPELKARNESMMFYFFPFKNLITVEFRRHNPTAHGTPNRHAWAIRNYLWSVTGPRLVRDAERNVPDPTVRNAMIESFNDIWRLQLETVVKSDHTVARDQIIHYPPNGSDAGYTFSLYAFAEDSFPTILQEFFEFTREHFARTGYRANLIYVGYAIARDQHSLLSYSFDSPVITIDPVSTANAGWDGYLDAYNEFCSVRGGAPLFNQSPRITPAQVKKAYGARLQTFADTRKTFDPADRLLNDYFRQMLA
jgi:FAD binding domain-containing protein